ncbi:prolyl oligopeptidase family protein [Collimonas fungivorans]|uniref:Prolyl oligopeptidase family protein n=1 Tax=Collimonas fungivorans TaxID=158899 RepID=A0A127P5H8_9BURK|nr:pectin acetylesterase-family hydrolase [Collimonas fungivorans]AMO93100.1 prolyl oligopeptidase family protein [Collimonas fungivorans]
MPISKIVKELILTVLCVFAMAHGHAATAPVPDPAIPYYSWYEVTLPADSGASCANGTPYRFYINRAQSDNLLLGMEGGGACWSYGTCTGKGTGTEAGYSASNPDGIPNNYMNGTIAESLVSSLLSPIMTRMDFWSWLKGTPAVETQSWTQVFMPYCSADIHMGSAIRQYTDPTSGDWRLQHFNGIKNAQAVAQWLVAHGLSKPQRMLVWGMSAGGYGALADYAYFRDTLKPQAYSSLLNDSGTVFVTAFNADPAQHPSVYLYDTAKSQWGLDAAGGMLATNKKLLPKYDENVMGSVYRALSAQYPHDRLGYASFQQDKTISGYHYTPFVPAIQGLAGNTSALTAVDLALFKQELPGIQAAMAPLPNFGYYLPWARGGLINDHTVTTLTFSGTDIHENGINTNIGDFINDLLSQKDPADAPVMKVFRTEQWSDASFASVLGFLETIFSSIFG